MSTTTHEDRMAFEKTLIYMYMPDFSIDPLSLGLCAEGWVETNGGNMYKGRVDGGVVYPFSKPELYLLCPSSPRTRSGRLLSSLGASHAFHVLGTGSNGFLRICHTDLWDATMTLLQVLIKFVAWVEAYDAHLRTGRDLADFLCG